MKILRKDTDLNILLNTETDFQTNLGWEENLKEFETEILNDIINPIENYETVRYIHKPYTGITSNTGDTQTDIWFYFHFLSGGTYVQDYTPQGISSQENENMLKQATESFFRLEFFKTPGTVSGNVLTCEPPTRQNRKLIFAKNLSLPLGEKIFYNPLNGYVHLPVFQGSNYKNKENMYFFWFQDESVLTETNLSGSTTGNTFFMTAKFYNAKDGTILDFTNDCFSTGHTITEQNDMYYQVNIDKRDYSYQVFSFNGTTGSQRGKTNTPIKFYESGGGNCFIPSPTPTPTVTPTNTPTPTVTPTTTPGLTTTPTPTPTSSAVTSYQYQLGPSYTPANTSLACSKIGTDFLTEVYAATDVAANVVQFFTNPGLTNGYAGEAEYHAYYRTGGVATYTGQVSISGFVTNKTSC